MKIVMIGLAALAVVLIGGGVWLYSPDESRASLEAAYGVGPGDYMTVGGVRLRVKLSGPVGAPAILLLHGFGASLETWDAWAADLSTDFRIIRLDLPGFGLTGPDPAGDYSDGHMLDLLSGLLDQAGIARATVIGNSLGGKLAWLFALRYPGRVDRLVLISPDGFASPGFDYGKPPDVPLMMRALPYVLPRALLRASIAPAYADPSKLSDATVTRYSDMMRAPGVRPAILDRTAQVRLEDPAPLLPHIQAPTLLLWGEKDAMIPFTNAAEYLRLMPHATLVPLPTLGHVPFEEAPEISIAPLRQFLR